MGSNPSNYMLRAWRPSNGGQGLRMTLVAGQSPWARAWTEADRLYARSVCDTKVTLQLQYAACGALY